MKIKRRDFLKGAASGAILAALTPCDTARAEQKPRLPEAVGILYDATLCVGCQVCMVACRKANTLYPTPSGPDRVWDNPADLSAKTINIIKKYEHGEAKIKDSAEGYSFVKRHCMHCVDPACVSVCPVTALTKDQETGVVGYDPNACIGCRYCQVACPYNIPKFEWDNPFPKIVKCQLCNHLYDQGRISACCSECPTGASLFGPVDLLLAEARRRLDMESGRYYPFPVEKIGGATVEQPAANYQQTIYGEHEGGGTQVLMLAGVDFELLGLPDLPNESYTSLAETIQHTVYKGLALPAIAFAGLAYLVKRNSSDEE